MDLPFLELFRAMYLAGVKFAIDNPKLVRMMSHLLVSKGQIYDDVFKNNIDIALDLYSSLIDRDKEQGRIRKDVDTRVFAQLVVDITTNVSINEVEANAGSFNYDNMIERITQILKIFENGVAEGE
ncbi:hypothetical protein ACAG96_02195 [Candidatus Izemoplasma sp. B36]|uniref:hypothetical protein n=1 Tax=Candidatus Izemoplasma sp. B36 TaxID=3242468 RepID=UPI00355892CD